MEKKDYLRSKTAPPAVVHKLLPRKGIAAIIDETDPDEAIHFVAPYGYGKTLAVLSWLKDGGRDAAWITLDASDDSEPNFYAGMSAAMMRFGGRQTDIGEILNDPRFIEDPGLFLSGAISDAESGRSERILVLDDFRFIRDKTLMRSVRDLISGLLERWRVIIIGRAELPSIFTDLILKGRMCFITPKELSFSPEEMTEFFAMNGCQATPGQIMSVLDETEGWPASLNVVLTTSRGGPVCYGEAARSYVMSFFESETWEELNGDVKNFLLRTSVLDKLTPAACRAVTGPGETLSVLRWLHANGLFITKLDERDAYCYHRVFRDFLRDRLKDSGISERELYGKLAWWLFDKNEMVEAFTCFFKAGDLYGVSQTLKTLEILSLDIESFLNLTGCLTALDPAVLRPYPIIVARMALIEFLKGNVSRMQTLSHIYEEWNEFGEQLLSPEEYAEYLWESGWLCYLDPEEPTRSNKRHLAFANYRYYVPHLKESHLARTALLNFPSFFRGMRDYGDDGIFETELILNRIESGEKHLVDEEEGVWRTYLILAEYKYETEDFARAEEIVRMVMTLAEDRRYTDLYFCCTVLLIKLTRAIRGAHEVGSLLSRLETIIRNNGHTLLLPNFHAFELRVRLAGGQAGFTGDFESENRDYEDKPYFYLLYRHLTLVRGYLSLGSYNRAILILGNLELLCKRYRRPTDLIEVNVLKAIALYWMGSEDSARRHLSDALSAAEPYGYMRIFSDDAKDLLPVLELVRKQSSGKYIQDVIISCKKALTLSGQKPVSKKAESSGLTKTERAILKSLSSGMSYAEIAHDGGIRVSTVKTHLHSIYSKLDVNNRTAAIIAAKEMGIIDG